VSEIEVYEHYRDEDWAGKRTQRFEEKNNQFFVPYGAQEDFHHELL